MSNWLGGMALAICLAAYLFAGLPGSQKTLPTCCCAPAPWPLYAYALVVPWLSPATIAVIRANAPRVANNFQSDTTQRIFVAGRGGGLPAARVGHGALEGRRATRASRCWSPWSPAPRRSAATGSSSRSCRSPTATTWKWTCSSGWRLVFAVWPAGALDRQRTWTARHIAGHAAADPGSSPASPIVKKQRRTARWDERPIEIETTIEYKTAKWLDAHMPGARVFAPGTIGFWLNAFSDAPQITGGFDNGISNPFVPAVIFHVYAGDNQQYMVDLLQAYGCDAHDRRRQGQRRVLPPHLAPRETARASPNCGATAATRSTISRGARAPWPT